MNEKLKTWMVQRTLALLRPIVSVLPKRFYLAGGCFSKDVNDLDLFPHNSCPLVMVEQNEVTFVTETINAVTWTAFGHTVQTCNYHHDSLSDLIASFDFAHIQAGVEVQLGGSGAPGTIEVVNALMTEDCIAARATGGSWYTGSEYPLSSLIRLTKYHARSAISRTETIGATLTILADIVTRGFAGYDDFKDQLDAVDLGLTPDDMGSMEWSQLESLFNALNKGPNLD
jgi:hypothetical protein